MANVTVPEFAFLHMLTAIAQAGAAGAETVTKTAKTLDIAIAAANVAFRFHTTRDAYEGIDATNLVGHHKVKNALITNAAFSGGNNLTDWQTDYLTELANNVFLTTGITVAYNASPSYFLNHAVIVDAIADAQTRYIKFLNDATNPKICETIAKGVFADTPARYSLSSFITTNSALAVVGATVNDTFDLAISVTQGSAVAVLRLAYTIATATTITITDVKWLCRTSKSNLFTLTADLVLAKIDTEAYSLTMGDIASASLTGAIIAQLNGSSGLTAISDATVVTRAGFTTDASVADRRVEYVGYSAMGYQGSSLPGTLSSGLATVNIVFVNTHASDDTATTVIASVEVTNPATSDDAFAFASGEHVIFSKEGSSDYFSVAITEAITDILNGVGIRTTYSVPLLANDTLVSDLFLKAPNDQTNLDGSPTGLVILSEVTITITA